MSGSTTADDATPLPAAPVPPAGDLVRFGSFVFDVVTGELRKGGVPVHLQQQPARLLALLVGRAGRLVPRDEIRRHLWAGDVFVDFQRGLNFCVMQIRAALEDDAEQPRYVETLPRRGYRFVAKVEAAGFGASPAPSADPPPRVVGRTSAPRRAAAVGVLAAGMMLTGGAGGSPTVARSGEIDAGSARAVRVAVLPFQDLAAGGDELVAEGLTEELIAEVGRLSPSRLSVVARTSVQRYRDRRVDLAQVGRDLGVEYVLEGSVRRLGERFRVTARLVRLADESQVWAESYEPTAPDALSLQREIARAAATGVGIALGPSGPRPSPGAPAHPEAQRLYLLGLRARDSRTVAGLEEARRSFERAIDLSPEYAPPHAALADTWLSLARRGVLSPAEALRMAEGEAQAALRLDPASDVAHAALGVVARLGRWDLPTARRHLERALALNPSNSIARQWYALVLYNLGHLPEGIGQARESARADPLSPTAHYYLGKLLLQAARPQEALEVAGRLAEADAEAVTGPLLRGDALQALGRAAEAIPEFERASRLDPGAPLPMASLAFALVRAGRTAEAQATYAGLKDLQRERPFINTLLALVASDLGESDDAVRFYEQALDAHEFDLVDARDAACLGPLRHDPRFVALELRLAAEVRRDPS